MSIIEVENLTRRYDTTTGVLRRRKKSVEAVRGVSFAVGEGEIFGLLGPNGAGKTTTIKILTTLLAPTSGRARVLGHDCLGGERAIRPRINAIFGGERNLYWRLSGLDNLRYFSDLYRVPRDLQKRRIPELLDLVGLSGRERERVEGYSKGMKQRLQIARGLVNDPEVLFLDEPTIGLDPAGARDLREIIRRLKALGKTVLLTTHYMFEADELSDRIAFIDHGRIVAAGTPRELKAGCAGKSLAEVRLRGSAGEAPALLSRLPGAGEARVEADGEDSLIAVPCADPQALLPAMIAALAGRQVLAVQAREATLEDAYLGLLAADPVEEA